MHNAAFRELGLDWRYEAIDVEPERFAERACESLPGRGSRARTSRSRTSCARSRSPTTATDVARAVGAANTLVFDDGRVQADNTDVEGFLTALRERAPEAPGGHATRSCSAPAEPGGRSSTRC